MDNDKQEALALMGTLGFDLDDVRVLLPAVRKMSDAKVEECLKRGKALHRLNVSAKLYSVIESPMTSPRDLIAAEKHLRDVHAKVSTQTGAQELLNLLRGTVPAIAPPDYIDIGEEDDNEV